jgi:hypothetical protein
VTLNRSALHLTIRCVLDPGDEALVLTPAWPNGSATADFMRVFHRRLASGATTSSALRDAKRALRDSPSTAHPFFWSGFVLISSAPDEWMASRTTVAAVR